jgi:hypothetical protein
MALYGAYQRITTGNVRTTIDSSTVPLNGPPRQPLGTIYSPPINVGLATTTGQGAPPIYKYVQYQSTANPAVVAAPAPVYYTDETFTVVSGVFTESFLGAAGSIAGYLMPNSTDYSGLTAALLNGNWVWIQIGGYLKGAYAPTAGTNAVGTTIIGSTGNWTSTAVAVGTAPSSRVLGMELTAVASAACDVLVGTYSTFWGS